MSRTFVPPQDVADEARRGLALRAKQPPSNRCCTSVGLRRAAQLANRQPVSVDTLRRMRSYFQRHAVDGRSPRWGHDSKGWQAWLAWGGDAGRQWCNQILDSLASDSVRNPRRLVHNPYLHKFIPPGGKFYQYVYSEQDIAERHAKKAKTIDQFRKNEQALRSAVKRDVAEGDGAALAVALIMATYERVGNAESAAEGHFGVTGWLPKHFTRDGSRFKIDYVGKSGVQQTKVIDQPWLVEALAKRLRQCKRAQPVVGVGPSAVNRYLDTYHVTAKDLRGYGANTEMCKELMRLRKRGPALVGLSDKDVAKMLKAEFNAALAIVAGRLGHTTSVLRKQYLVQEMEPTYLGKGVVSQAFA